MTMLIIHVIPVAVSLKLVSLHDSHHSSVPATHIAETLGMVTFTIPIKIKKSTKYFIICFNQPCKLHKTSYCGKLASDDNPETSVNHALPFFTMMFTSQPAQKVYVCKWSHLAESLQDHVEC